MNSVNIIGRLTTELELRRTQDGTAVCSYTLAVKRPKVKDVTDFIECVTWRQGAEYLSKYGHKGDILAVSGSLQSRKWTDKNGNKIWENDVVEFEDTGEEGYEYKEGYDFINRARVEFAEARWSLTDFIDTNSGVVDEMYNHIEFMDFWQYCEVIGNIFDNPELLGE